jgi:hypothetical protein
LPSLRRARASIAVTGEQFDLASEQARHTGLPHGQACEVISCARVPANKAGARVEGSLTTVKDSLSPLLPAIARPS